MGKGPKTFSQRRHTKDQQAHEKMSNIIHQQGNANQNHKEVSLHVCQNIYTKKK